MRDIRRVTSVEVTTHKIENYFPSSSQRHRGRCNWGRIACSWLGGVAGCTQVRILSPFLTPPPTSPTPHQEEWSTVNNPSCGHCWQAGPAKLKRMTVVSLGGYFCTTVCVIKPKPLTLLSQSSGVVIIVFSLNSPVTPVDPGLH